MEGINTLPLKKIVIKGSDFDKLYEVFDDMDFRAYEYVPTIEELKYMIQDLVNYGVFLLWLDDTGDITEENEAAHELISDVIKHFIIIDNSQ